VLLRLLALAGAPVELAEAEVAVGDEGARLSVFTRPVISARRSPSQLQTLSLPMARATPCNAKNKHARPSEREK